MQARFDEISPITNELHVMVETYNNKETGKTTFNKICMSSGYMHFSDWIEGSEELKLQENSLPKVTVANRKVFNKEVWYPAYFPTNKAILFNVMEDKGSGFKWAVAEVKPVPEQSKEEYALNGTFDAFLDVDNSLYFPSDDFPSAFDKLMTLTHNTDD